MTSLESLLDVGDWKVFNRLGEFFVAGSTQVMLVDCWKYARMESNYLKLEGMNVTIEFFKKRASDCLKYHLEHLMIVCKEGDVGVIEYHSPSIADLKREIKRRYG